MGIENLKFVDIHVISCEDAVNHIYVCEDKENERLKVKRKIKSKNESVFFLNHSFSKESKKNPHASAPSNKTKRYESRQDMITQKSAFRFHISIFTRNKKKVCTRDCSH